MTFLNILDKINTYLNRLLIGMGGAFLVAMIALGSGNIIFRWAWLPIRGTYELMGLFGAVAASFALGSTQSRRGHIAVDVLVNRFPANIRRVVQTVSSGAGMLLFSMLTWQIIRLGLTLRDAGELTESLGIIYYPFIFAVALGCGAMSLVLLADIVRGLVVEKAGDI